MSEGAKKAWGESFPKNYYEDCVGRPRPCPWVGCEHHLLLDVNPSTGTITLNVGRVTRAVKGSSRTVNITRRHSVIAARGRPEEKDLLKRGTEMLFEELRKSVETGSPTCVLDCVEGEKAYTLEEIGDIFNLTRERVRQIESKAAEKLRRLGKEGEEWRLQKEA